MASVEQLKMTHSIDGKVTEVRDDVQDVHDNVQGVGSKVQDVRGDVRDVPDKVQDVDNRVQDIGKDISIRVQGVDDKLNLASRSLFLNTISSFRRLKQHLREPAQRQPSTMAIAPRSVHQS